jgi:hypothetical protein
MVNAEILSGIRAALERGQSLRAAMMSFYNAGYAKDEIEDAARALMEVGATQQTQTQTQPPAKPVQPQKQLIQQAPQKVSLQQPKPQMQISPQVKQPVIQPIQVPLFQKKEIKPIVQQKPKEEPKQKVSGYETKVKPKRNNAMIVVLILILVILIGMLASIFLFKQQLIDWLSTMF